MKAPLNIGLLGLGTVGGAVANHLQHDGSRLAGQAGRALNLVAVCAREPHKKRAVEIPQALWVSDPMALATDPRFDVVIELIGGTDDPAYSVVQAALQNNKPVITANKAMLAKHWATFMGQPTPLMFEAAVCGGIPIIKVLREGLAGNRVSAISGILNGTCNYILSTMESQNRDFADVLREAQNLGYAEADPSLDIDGFDAAHKLLILAKLAFDPAVTMDDIAVSGIRHITLTDILTARADSKTIRLVASARQNDKGLSLSVAPQILPLDHPLAHVAGPMNAVSVEAEPVQLCTLMGPGAGAGPTASAVLADLIDLARKMG